MKTNLLIFLVSVFVVAGSGASAHHSFAAVLDADSPVEATGTVTKVEWMNPHAWIYIDVESENSEVVNWAFELGSRTG